MDRTRIEDVLLKMGVPAGLKGFNYIADAVEYIDEYGEDISVTKELYPEIAKRRNTTPSRVERAVRHAFGVARSARGDYKIVEKYIGFADCTNSNSLVMLHKRISQECKELEEDSKTKEKYAEQTNAITTLRIKSIVRQELKLALDELKEKII